MAPLLVPKAPGTKEKRQEVTMSATKAASESDRAGIGAMGFSKKAGGFFAATWSLLVLRNSSEET